MTKFEKSTRYFQLNAIFCFLAAAISGYLLHHHYQTLNGEASFQGICSIAKGFDCETVNSSKYSEILGVPVAALSFAFYLFSFLINVFGFLNPYFRKTAALLLFPLTSVAALFSLGMFLVSLLLINALCLFCTFLYVLVFIILALTFLGLRDTTDNALDEYKAVEKKKIWGPYLAFLVLALLTHGVTRFLLYRPLPFNEAVFVTSYKMQPKHDIDVGSSPKMGFMGDNPPLQIIEFADFECPMCGIAAKYMHRLVQNNKDKVQLVFKHFPLDLKCNKALKFRIHENACLAAKAAYCAHEQGKFSEYYKYLFDNQRLLKPEPLRQWAKTIKLNLNEFDSCVQSERAEKTIQNDIALAQQLQVRGTPTFFVNGKKVDGIINEDRLRSLMKENGITH